MHRSVKVRKVSWNQNYLCIKYLSATRTCDMQISHLLLLHPPSTALPLIICTVHTLGTCTWYKD